MGIRNTLANLGTKSLKRSINVLGGDQAAKISAYLAENIPPTITKLTKYGELKFFCPGILPEWRARTLLTKEPETIEWINGFKSNDILWDIGANVGSYSLYAALKGLTVWSFEPSPSNYYLLSRNIEINKMDDRISALCLAFNNNTKLDSLYMTMTELGGSMNSVSEPIDWQGKQMSEFFKQATVGFSIDNFVEQFNLTIPNHIKIDVDGVEDKIIEGAAKTLANEKIKSLLIELDTERKEYYYPVVSKIEESGLKLSKKEHATELDTSKFSKVYNHIFFRESDGVKS